MTAVADIAFDTNVLFYALDHADREKHERCRSLLTQAMNRGFGCVPLQTLGEVCFAAARKKLVSKAVAATAAKDWGSAFEVITATPAAFETALDWWSADRLAFWDAVLLASCAEAGVGALISEDMADGATFGGVEIVSPFVSDLAARLAVHGMTL